MSAAAAHVVQIEDEGEEGVPECRICRQSGGQLVSACRCNTVVHADCLERWVRYRADALFPLLSVATREECEICRHPLDVGARGLWGSRTGGVASGAASGAMGNEKEEGFLLTRAVASMTRRVLEAAFTVEGCLFIFLFMLAVMGHALFVLGVYRGAENDEHSLKRVGLALANAVLTFTLLIFVQKVAARWLRDAEHGSPSIVAPLSDEEHNSAQPSDWPTQSSSDRYASRCTTLSQVLLGAVLSVVAAAEIFLLVRELPLGGLA